MQRKSDVPYILLVCWILAVIQIIASVADKIRVCIYNDKYITDNIATIASTAISMRFDTIIIVEPLIPFPSRPHVLRHKKNEFGIGDLNIMANSNHNWDTCSM